ncbi:hypothetical protein [Nostoc sp. FACHB-190]|uniref:hypothetical protein n=1 Tax=Nostoc sp. FACHB-190 TaxID=2692838 RepID=UPI00168804A8|nr:hypothetical protein [Nostoc sp. FACHB-190]MBD2299369.1 hypothetical protein [Nostoc sp. FACHB-190]
MTIIKSLQKRNLYRFEPIAYLLLEKFQLSPLAFGLLGILIGSSIYLITAWISNTLWLPKGQVGLLQDILPWIWLLLINPVVLGYYLWSFQAIDFVIQELEESDVLEIDESEIQAINQISFNAYKSKWRIFLALISGIIFSLFVFGTRFKLQNSWTSSHPLPIIIVSISTLCLVYLGSILVINLITNIWILHSILKRALARKQFNVNPLHPDRCGGLRSLSDYAIKTAYLAAVLGLMVGFIEYQFLTRGTGQNLWFVHLIIPLDILLSIVCFFGPLVAAHRGMNKAKEELLHEIARQFQADYAQIHSSLTGNAETLKQGTEKIRNLRAFYALTDKFPVWPFDVQTFRQFLLTVSAPLLPLVIGSIQKLIPILLKKWGINFS